MDPDLLLLRRYVHRTDQGAFEAVVRRHVDVVYAAAMRQLRDAHHAQDVTQAVFILLARKAGNLPDNLLVGGWLVNATRWVCRTFQRAERRRVLHEQQAAAMRFLWTRESQSTSSSESTTDEVTEVLDDALARLDQMSRGVVVMQYLQGQSSRDIAAALGISEIAARKRASRALLKLRRAFAQRGVVTSAESLGATLMVMKCVAPTGLAATTATAVGSSAGTTTAGTTTVATLAKATASAVVVTQAKAAAVVLAMIVAVGASVGVTAVAMQRAVNTAALPPTAPAPALPATPVADNQPQQIHGVVLNPDGQSAAGAQIMIGTPDQRANVYTRPGRPRPNVATASDATGNFSVNKPAGPFALVVCSPTGFAEAFGGSFQDGSTIKLASWGKIQGTIVDAGKPVSRGTVLIWRIPGTGDPLRDLVEHQTTARADAKGHYTFAQVAPGEVWICRQDTGRFDSYQYLQVPAGQSMDFTIGPAPDGHHAFGHVEVPPELARFVAWTRQGRFTYEASIRLETAQQGTKHDPSETPQQYREAEEAYGRTDAGRIAKEWYFGKQFTVRPDGTFQIDGLPAGKFDISVRNFEDLKEANFNEDVAGAERALEISTTQPTEPPIDLGTIKLTPRAVLRPGDVAPDFTVTAIDDTEWRLADHKGKPVVLVMWGAYNSWQEEMVAVGDFCKRWANDPRVSILGVYTAENDRTAAEFIQKYGLVIPHTNEGDKLMNLYHNSWPSAVLIDADGKVVMEHLHAKTLEELLLKLLAK